MIPDLPQLASKLPWVYTTLWQVQYCPWVKRMGRGFMGRGFCRWKRGLCFPGQQLIKAQASPESSFSTVTQVLTVLNRQGLNILK